ncbi:MAG: signal peptidase II [Candidatus Parabeggiatoa sp. nov. 1]|nr:MAG: signal peptidase II [Gammaproteobacteria bacterium]
MKKIKERNNEAASKKEAASKNDPPLQKGKTNALIWLRLSLFVIVLDQLSKIWASATLELQQPVAVLAFFDLTLLHNYGAAFGFLGTADGWQRWFLSALAVVICGVIVIWLGRIKRQQWWLACALALVLGGALGNVLDRVMYGYVVDFIDIYYQQWHWPAFNIADSAISIGAVMLIIDALRGNAER